MVDISSAISSASSLTASAASGTATTASTVADNYDTFLQLLTTQLKNQDPMNPLDTNQFTQQLVQYTEVEQQLQANKSLSSLVQLASANASVALVNYVGKDTTISGSTIGMTDGAATWQLDVPSDASNVTYVVKDTAGNEVYSETGALSAGSSSFSWDGTGSDGQRYTSGQYSLTVTASNDAGTAVNVKTAIRGRVEGVDMTGDSPVLIINGAEYDVDDVQSIYS